MLFNLDASNRAVIRLEGRTCCYLHREQTSALPLALCFFQSHIFSITRNFFSLFHLFVN